MSRDRARGTGGVVEVAFTDRHGGVSPPPFDSLDLSRPRPGRAADIASNLALLAGELGVSGFATMRQAHGADVEVVTSLDEPPRDCDGLVADRAGVALCVRVGDCVPVVLADVDAGVVGVAHAGRPGLVAGVVQATVAAMRSRGADGIEAWIGPHICGGCYEVPAAMRSEVAAVIPAAFACTTWGTPSVDLGAAARALLAQVGCAVHDRSVCTRESADLFSHRRDGARSGRSGGLVVLRDDADG